MTHFHFIIDKLCCFFILYNNIILCTRTNYIMIQTEKHVFLVTIIDINKQLGDK